ncbi:MAG: YggT family protein [Candidatus Poriferisodalaceae bacterium]
MISILCTICNLFVLAIFGRIIFSWIPIAGNSPVATVGAILIRITEPVMGPLRRALPPLRLGGMSLDLSPIIVLIMIQTVLMGRILQCG